MADQKRIEGTPEHRAYLARVKAQTFAWAQGRPYHNRVDDECCPDFSCCNPELFETDPDKRWAKYRSELPAQAAKTEG